MNPELSRRDLIKILGLAAGTAALPQLSSASAADGRAISPAKLASIQPLAKPVTAIVLGAGNRGSVYASFAAEYPGQLKIVGVAEPIPFRNERQAKAHGIASEHRFKTWEDVFTVPKFADAVIISTPDNLHHGPCMKALAAGYDVLLEKPISPSEQECRDILRLAKETGRVVAVCHVLRYAPYFVKLRELVQAGAVGELVSIQHMEPIEHTHMSHSYVRGNWHNSKETTPIILAKSCHDLDILRWIVGQPARQVQAFGDLKWFRKENAPAGSTARCAEGCAIESTCPYSALKLYHRDRTRLYVFDLPEDKSNYPELILEKLRTTNYGRCVYRMDNDQPDHYVANILFEKNITASFSMEAFTSYSGRRTRIMGSHGDIVGDMREFTLTNFITGQSQKFEQKTDDHGGGDWRLAENWVQAVSRHDPSLLTSTLDASIESHVMGFMAEKSRLQGQVMTVSM